MLCCIGNVYVVIVLYGVFEMVDGLFNFVLIMIDMWLWLC